RSPSRWSAFCGSLTTRRTTAWLTRFATVSARMLIPWRARSAAISASTPARFSRNAESCVSTRIASPPPEPPVAGAAEVCKARRKMACSALGRRLDVVLVFLSAPGHVPWRPRGAADDRQATEDVGRGDRPGRAPGSALLGRTRGPEGRRRAQGVLRGARDLHQHPLHHPEELRRRGPDQAADRG